MPGPNAAKVGEVERCTSQCSFTTVDPKINSPFGSSLYGISERDVCGEGVGLECWSGVPTTSTLSQATIVDNIIM